MKMFLIICGAIVAAFLLLALITEVSKEISYNACVDKAAKAGLGRDQWTEAGCRIGVNLRGY